MTEIWQCPNCSAFTMTEAGVHGWCRTCETKARGSAYEVPSELRLIVAAQDAKRKGQTQGRVTNDTRQPNPRRQRCKRGHPLTGDNVYVDPRRGKRRCRECMRERDRHRFGATTATLPAANGATCYVCGQGFTGLVTREPGTYRPIHPACETWTVAEAQRVAH